jgi:hypothetical protein
MDTLKDEQGARQLGMKPVKSLLVATALALLLSGCNLAANRDVRAYNACLARHAQDMVVCEGPRQAYEAELPVFQARSAAVSSTEADPSAVPASSAHQR